VPVRVTLLDGKIITFQPLLYRWPPRRSHRGHREPLRAILRKQDNTEVVLADVQQIDPARAR